MVVHTELTETLPNVEDESTFLVYTDDKETSPSTKYHHNLC